MTAHTSARPTPLMPLLLGAGLLASLGLRISLAGPAGGASIPAGLAFGICLLALAQSAGLRTRPSRRAFMLGIIGSLCLCLPALLINLKGGFSPVHGSYLIWAPAVSFVALAEEAFLRGVLYSNLYRSYGLVAAIIIPAALFALIHLPLYGWHSLPLDFSVGIFLGGLRQAGGSWLAPGAAHVIADLAGWWL